MGTDTIVPVILVAVVVVGALMAAFGWDRYHSERPKPGSNPGARPTIEIFVDPVSGKRQRVWSDPITGEREYRDE